ncbi:hypothetical protein K503DRAFT_799037 [Rhizopogon vinicolor AM-OR11-026]|uniref:Uncharacterized protein n=1 Tax=Rhizopogon vinicolor AM-OR11-026 TaxID=1314800 RepID=A0A1B7N5K4_9AGAM|nr:hypothetical protein K503DRAFT_799037 [Rhizopogon vinicolor AM-OR11-026]
MNSSTPPCASEAPSPRTTVPPQHTSSGHASMADDALQQSPRNPSCCVITIQNNSIAEGVTINIFSSHCIGSAVTKLDHVAPTAEPTLLRPPQAMQPELVEHGRDSIVFCGNSFGECVMLNIKSPNCIGAVKQTALRPKSTTPSSRRK